MNILSVLIAALIVGGTGIIIGVLLGIAGQKFMVKVDEKELAVRDALPGNNCGGCGYPGCDGLASAIAKGEADINACPVGGEKVAETISEIMGVEASDTVKKVAFVKCAGDCENAKELYDYVGPKDCKLALNNPALGSKACKYGCTGFGDCKKVCPFDAIDIIDGIAVIDKEKCKACGKCIVECPRHLIEMVHYDKDQQVRCNSNDKGVEVKKVCNVGCIGCGICAKYCPSDAITMENNLAHIDNDKCVDCGVCARECPVKIITK